MHWIPGGPVKTSDQFLNHAARYLAHVRCEFPASEPVQFGHLAELIASNAPHAPETSRWSSAVRDPCAVQLDARMFPHEWIATSAGYLKVDALDHHDDHFFPGPQDIAWDVDGTIVEFQLDAAAENYFLECYERNSADRNIRTRLPFYRLAYLAFRFGYSDLAMRSLEGTEDAARFRKDCARYKALLEIACG
jgi:hypothetical protein